MKTKQSKIFVVEDDVIYQELIKHKLNEANYSNVKFFSTGEEFLNALHENPSIVVLDYNLDGMNGLSILQKIKSYNPEIHVIFLSGQESLEVAINTLKYGAYDYIIKNKVALDRLVQLLKRVITLEHIIRENRIYKRLKNALIFFIGAIVATVIGLKIFFPGTI